MDDAYALVDKKHLLKDKTKAQAFEEVCGFFGVQNLEGDEAAVALRNVVMQNFIDTRSKALAALKEGMTLDGKVWGGVW